jgi:hypothetical protein
MPFSGPSTCIVRDFLDELACLIDANGQPDWVGDTQMHAR